MFNFTSVLRNSHELLDAWLYNYLEMSHLLVNPFGNSYEVQE
jgi:hypothetical protein